MPLRSSSKVSNPSSRNWAGLQDEVLICPRPAQANAVEKHRSFVGHPHPGVIRGGDVGVEGFMLLSSARVAFGDESLEVGVERGEIRATAHQIDHSRVRSGGVED